MKMTFQLRTVLAIVSAIALFAGAQTVRAQGMTSEQATEMLNELKQIRQLLERQPAAPGQAAPAPDDKVNISFASGGFSMGKADAPLVMVEYGDFQCPFCQQYHNTAFAQIKANYVDTGKLRYIHRDFPLDFHENARRAAAAARCAGEQGQAKFWDMRHVLIVNASSLQQDKLAGYAATAKLDVPKFNACVAADKFKASIDKDVAEGTAAGVSGTPSFVIGHIKNDRLEGVRLVGAAPYDQFDVKIQEMLTKTN